MGEIFSVFSSHSPPGLQIGRSVSDTSACGGISGVSEEALVATEEGNAVPRPLDWNIRHTAKEQDLIKGPELCIVLPLS